MYDNLTADDVIDEWSKVHLDQVINDGRWHTSLTPARRCELTARLMLLNEAKRPFRERILSLPY